MQQEFATIFPLAVIIVIAMAALVAWQSERRMDRRLRREEIEARRHRDEREEMRREKEQEREAARQEKEAENARFERYVRKREAEEEKIKVEAGAGSGGYIVVDLPDAQRGLFHDLLKGFEDYARLKGYGVTFSVDTTFHDRIAFKFTLTDPDVIVGNERIRKDLREYIERVTSGDLLEDMPQIVSLEEHELLVTMLRNRISFLQHNFNLAKNAAEFYQGLLSRMNDQRFLPSPNIVVQTGGAYNANSYSALNSPQSVLGIENKSSNSVRVAITHKERQIQIDQLREVVDKLLLERDFTGKNDAIRNLENIKDELENAESPEPGMVARWLERAKQALQLGSLGLKRLML
jgi:hypothetical protein